MKSLPTGDVFMLLIVGTVRLPPASLPAAKVAMANMIEASRAEPGCIEYVYAEDVLEAGLIHVKEMWSSREALHRHFQSHHIAQWRSSWKDLQISGRSLRLYEVGDAEPV
jgi:quinol monooxygenase YgiN